MCGTQFDPELVPIFIEMMLNKKEEVEHNNRNFNSGGSPAILKGWFDRVFSAGFAYQVTDRGIEGLIKGKKAAIISTSGGDENGLEASGTISVLQTMIIRGTLGFSGITDVRHMNCYAVPTVSDHERKKYLENVASFVDQY